MDVTFQVLLAFQSLANYQTQTKKNLLLVTQRCIGTQHPIWKLQTAVTTTLMVQPLKDRGMS
jgi:hypothetical protein